MRRAVVLWLVGVEVVYLVCGGLVFWTLESDADQSQSVTTTVDLSQLVRNFTNNKTCITEAELLTFIAILNEVQWSPSNSSSSSSSGWNWDIPGSIFFAMTVVSTIGYGNLSPTKASSKAFCCAYALIGIPLTLVVMLAIGDRLNKLAGRVETRLVHKRPRAGKLMRSTLILSLGIICFLLLPAVGFMRQENWSYGTSLYYALITLTTVGFGDYVAGFECGGSLCGMYRLTVGLWIYVGLAWLSGLISSIQDSFHALVRQRKDKLQETAMVVTSCDDPDDNTSTTRSDAVIRTVADVTDCSCSAMPTDVVTVTRI